MRTTTLAKIRSFDPCEKEWKKLLRRLGKTKADNRPLPYSMIVRTCGLDAALWATRTETDYRWVQELAIEYARRAVPFTEYSRAGFVLDTAQKYLEGQVGRKKLLKAISNARKAYYNYTHVSFCSSDSFAIDAVRLAAKAASASDPVHVSDFIDDVCSLVVNAVFWSPSEYSYSEVKMQTQEFLEAVS